MRWLYLLHTVRKNFFHFHTVISTNLPHLVSIESHRIPCYCDEMVCLILRHLWINIICLTTKPLPGMRHHSTKASSPSHSFLPVPVIILLTSMKEVLS